MVLENNGGNAHVPTQLLSPDQAEGGDEKEENYDEDDDIEEFASVGGALGGGSGFGGYTAPLGSKNKKK